MFSARLYVSIISKLLLVEQGFLGCNICWYCAWIKTY